jgi:hypothetical protein
LLANCNLVYFAAAGSPKFWQALCVNRYSKSETEGGEGYGHQRYGAGVWLRTAAQTLAVELPVELSVTLKHLDGLGMVRAAKFAALTPYCYPEDTV